MPARLGQPQPDGESTGRCFALPSRIGDPRLDFDNVTKRSLSWIWTNSAAFARFRGTEWLAEPCHSCALREVDRGGCRCQVALFGGNLDEPDPVCELSPRRGLVDEWLRNAELARRPGATCNRTGSLPSMRSIKPKQEN